MKSIALGWSLLIFSTGMATGSCLSPRGGGLVESRARAETATVTVNEKESPRVRAPVVLVTLDGARWQEIFGGTDVLLLHSPRAARTASELMPNLHALAHDRGAFVGAPGKGSIVASGPNFVSLPGYTEIFTGRPSLACANNDCPATQTPTILDGAVRAGRTVAAFASWDRLARAVSSEPGTFEISAGRAPGEAAKAHPGTGAYRPDDETADVALARLERDRPDFLFIGLGDPDEYAHASDYDGYVKALEKADDVLRRISDVLDRMGERGKATHLFVTADHGRAKDFHGHGAYAPESSRVWLLAAGPKVRARGSCVSPRERHLADVAPTIAAVSGLAYPRGEPSGDVLDELFE